MHTEVRAITPNEASLLLQSNNRNRPLNESNIAFFESQLRNSEMQLTHQGIAISETGILLDGQHRLTAIVRTGIPATMLVATGLPDKIFSVLDTGRKRTAGDVLAMDGGRQSVTMAAGIRLFLLYNESPNNWWNGKLFSELTSLRVQSAFRADPDGWQWAATTARTFHSFKFVVPGPMSCLLFLAYRSEGYSCSYLKHFADQLKNGMNLSAGDPILAYRNKMLNVGSQKGQERLADYIKLFNACATGQQLKIFKSQQHPPMPSLVHASESIHENAAA